MARIESFIGSAKQWTQKFRYDSVGRLKEAEEFRGDTGALSFEQIFEFDNFGNLYRKSASNPGSGEDPIAFEPIENADIDKSTNRFSGASGVAYDNAGRVVSDDKFRDADFLYDANGRMVRTARSGVPDAETVYDGFGNRVLTKVQGVWELALYDAFGRLSVEYGGSTQMDEGGVRYVHQDHQGSVRTVTNAAGFVAARRDYQPFGEAIQAGVGLRTGAQGYEGGVGARQGYGLTEGDEASGLSHTWFRKLDAAAGRWTGPDPYNGSASLIEPDSWNRYTYVENEPTNYVDPLGLLIVQRCQKYWWYDGNGGYHQTITGCVTIYDDSGSATPDVGAGANADEKQYLLCVKAVEKKYEKFKRPEKNWDEYVKARDRLKEDFDRIYGEANSISAVDVAIIIAGLAAGRGLGAILAGLGLVVKYQVRIDQIYEQMRIAVRRLQEDYPKQFEYDEQMAYKGAELDQCAEKYLPKDHS
ncbi:MAG: RHS repeat-associated core domain-containing protein [Pyrinomonadaceae bacterium]